MRIEMHFKKDVNQDEEGGRLDEINAAIETLYGEEAASTIDWRDPRVVWFNVNGNVYCNDEILNLPNKVVIEV